MKRFAAAVVVAGLLASGCTASASFVAQTTPSADQVKAWPIKWCEAQPGMTRQEMRLLMGPPTDEFDQASGTPEMSWDFNDYQFNAFMDNSDVVRQLDVNDIQLTASERAAINCEFSRTDNTDPSEDTPTSEETTSSPPAAPDGNQLNQRVLVEDEFGDTAGFVTLAGLKRATPGEFYTLKGVLFSIAVTVEGSKGSFDVNPLLLTARTVDGDTCDTALGGTDAQLDTTTVTPGQKVRGPVAFDCPKGQLISTIIWTDGLSGQLAAWTIR